MKVLGFLMMILGIIGMVLSTVGLALWWVAAIAGVIVTAVSGAGVLACIWAGFCWGAGTLVAGLVGYCLSISVAWVGDEVSN